jgi:EAL domain-containing protein (putative c-di-GMP-specific phosphodiesterase class I)
VEGVVVPKAAEESRLAPERALLDAARRIGRSTRLRMALAVHLSRLLPPGPRPHHRRIALAILEETARKHEGQVFPLRCGDIVLICALPDQGTKPAKESGNGFGPANPAALVGTMAALLRLDLPDSTKITTYWDLQKEYASFMAYAAARAAETGLVVSRSPNLGIERHERVAAVGAIAALAESTPIGEHLRRQVGVRLPGPRCSSPSSSLPLHLLYEKWEFNTAALEEKIGATGEIGADPFLQRHLENRLNERLLSFLLQEAGTGSSFDILSAAVRGLSIHCNAPALAVAPEAVRKIADIAKKVKLDILVELSYHEAINDMEAFRRVVRTANAAHIPCVLRDVSYMTLLVSRPWMLPFDMIKIEWSSQLTDLHDGDRLQIVAALRQIGLEKIILVGTDNEAAMQWGVAEGIRMYQGGYINAVLAAERHRACPNASRCTWRECMKKATMVGFASERECALSGLIGRPHDAPASGERPAAAWVSPA